MSKCECCLECYKTDACEYVCDFNCEKCTINSN